MTAKPKLSSTKLSPCVCGDVPDEPEYDPYTPFRLIRCRACGYTVGNFGVQNVRNLWNAAMLGLNMEGKEK